ncbi:MAG: flavin reductase, partial [Duodenibacillus sp.]|nr:flavin reductase [Duodenibacillus sp.]
FALQLPTLAIARQTLFLGSHSKNNMPDKLEQSGVETFLLDGFDIPLVRGCAAWAVFRVVSEPHNQQAYDLFIGEAMGVWADDRVFRGGHWCFDEAPEEMGILHYVAGGHFVLPGKSVDIKL